MWYDNFMKKDPPDQNKFPRFQCWTDHDWSDFQEKVNDELRNRCVQDGIIVNTGAVEVDMGSYQGAEFKYLVTVAQETNNHERVQEAIESKQHQANWEDDYAADCVGWQQKAAGDDMEGSETKEKFRPVRIIRGPDEADPPGHFQ